MKFKIGRLYRNPKDHNQVIVVIDVSEMYITYSDIQNTHEEILSRIQLFQDWELIDGN